MQMYNNNNQINHKTQSRPSMMRMMLLLVGIQVSKVNPERGLTTSFYYLESLGLALIIRPRRPRGQINKIDPQIFRWLLWISFVKGFTRPQQSLHSLRHFNTQNSKCPFIRSSADDIIGTGSPEDSICLRTRAGPYPNRISVCRAPSTTTTAGNSISWWWPAVFVLHIHRMLFIEPFTGTGPRDISINKAEEERTHA